MSDLIPIKQIIRESGVKQWEIAKFIGISEFTLTRKLRDEPDSKFRQKILMAIEQLKK